MHVYILSGTQSGGTDPRTLSLDTIHDNSAALVSYGATLQYVVPRSLTLDTFQNVPTSFGVTLQNIVVRTLTLTTIFDNATDLVTYGVELALVPFVPDNTETTDLLTFFDQVYPTSDKRQIDTLITQLKNAGVWTKFDWYGNAHWAKSEHDALVNWKDVTKTLVKVGDASWVEGAGLEGESPTTSNSRYKSNWQIADGPHATATSFAFFVSITAIAAPENGMQPIGVWRRDFGGPSTPNGSFLSLSILANSGFAGANLMSGNGNTSFAAGTGIGVWGVSHSGTSQITVKDGATLETDVVSGSASYTDPDGMSVAGSAGTAKRSFPGTEVYWGWGSALTALEFAAIESGYAAALLPPEVITNALIVDDGLDYLVVDDDGNYLKVE
jgi:hypothetical protein